MRTRVKTALAAAAVFAWFLAHTWRGLLAYFQGDDMMNMYWAWDTALWKLALANLTPFTTVYRPFGAVYYRTMYALAGFHPEPFRAVCYLLLAANIAIAYRVAKLLTGSSEIALLAALLVSWHPNLMDLYQNGGTVYDILCFTCYYAALGVYCSGRPLTRSAALGYLALFVLALNSKEMAATLPAAVWIYELIYRPPQSWDPRTVGRWLRSGKLAAWISALALPLALAVKTGASSQFANAAPYVVSLSWRQYFITTRSWLAQLFFLRENALNTFEAVAILAAVAAIAVVSRRKYLRFCAALILILPLPVNFITLRGFFVMYIPLLAWAVFIAGVLVEIREWLWTHASLPSRTWEPERIFLFVAPALGLSIAASYDSFHSFEWIDPSQPSLQALHTGLVQNCQAPPSGSHMLLRSDPFEKDDWAPTLAIRLLYGVQFVLVDRGAGAGTDYQCVLDFAGGRFVAGR